MAAALACPPKPAATASASPSLWPRNGPRPTRAERMPRAWAEAGTARRARPGRDPGQLAKVNQLMFTKSAGCPLEKVM